MVGVIFYLFFLSSAYLAGLAFLLTEQMTTLAAYRIGLTCAVIGGLGGCLYCLRGIYLNASVRNQWSKEWHVWYFLRPIVSAACGGVSYLFLRAGLLVLESGPRSDASELGFYALAFVAGLNVDKFMKKIEEVSETIWGIEKSRTAKNAHNKKE